MCMLRFKMFINIVILEPLRNVLLMCYTGINLDEPKLLSMKTYHTASFLLITCALFSCSNNNTQIAENTFIHNDKVYKVIDNEIREIGDLSASNIKKFEVLKPKQRDLGEYSLAFVKQGATAKLKTLYRGNYLYFSLKLYGLNDLQENFRPGALSIQFRDEYGFILHSTDIPANELIKVVNDQGVTEYFVYNGKTEMSTDINLAINSYDVSSSIELRRQF